VEPLPIDVPAIVDELRRRARLSQRILAARAQISQQTLSAYERGSRSPSLDALQKVAAAAGFQLRGRSNRSRPTWRRLFRSWTAHRSTSGWTTWECCG
jgi:transcriptional regulator with XRE-family HTH domain